MEKITKKQIVVAVSPETHRMLISIRHSLEEHTDELWSLGRVVGFLCKEYKK